MAMKFLRDSASGGIGKFILFGILTLAVAGLALSSGNNFGGTGSNNVIKAASETVSIVEFDRNVRRQLAPLGISPQDAYSLGYINQIIAGEIREILMHKIADDSDITIDQDRIAAHITKILEPLAQNGENPQDILRQVLLNQGLTEKEFAADIAFQIKNTLITDTIKATAPAPNPRLVDGLYGYQYETRTVEYLKFLDTEIKIDKPNDEQLTEFYETIKGTYRIPETRDINILVIDDSKIKESITINDEMLQSRYDDDAESYNTPATRSIEQALLDTEEQAASIIEKVNAGTSLEKSVKDVTNSTVAYLGKQDAVEGELMEALEATVWDAKKGDLLGPISTPLGYAIVQINDISEARTQNFNDVKKDIKATMLEEAALDEKFALADTLEDLAASGASIDDIKLEVPVNVTAITKLGAQGTSQSEKKHLSNTDDWNTTVELAFDLDEGDISPTFEMSDGSIAAVQIQLVHPEGYHALDKIKTQLEARWVKEQQSEQTKARADEAIQAILEDGTSLKAYADKAKRTYRTAKNLKRQEAVTPFNTNAISQIFDAAANKPMLFIIDGGTAIVNVIDIETPVITDNTRKKKNYTDLETGLADTAESERLTIFIDSQNAKSPAIINGKLLEQAYGRSAEDY